MTHETHGAQPAPSSAPVVAAVPEDMQGRRLDQALELLLPDAGLRGRKRVWERFAVLVDGRARPKGYRVRAGQSLELRPLDGEGGAPHDGPPEIPPGVRVVAQRTGYMAALFKPAGVHSESLAGRPGPTLEACLPLFWPGREARLVNRLDLPTSGLVLAALCPEAAEAYRAQEDAAQAEKAYLALVRGAVDGPLVLTRALDTADRKRVRVLATDSPDPLRHTRVEPLAALPGRDATLVRALIRKGARHQIRAHLAAAGLPIVGDHLYGEGEEGGLYLHHFRVSLPDFQAVAEPLWPEWETLGVPRDSV
ncbi:pseudouridine synthase family protein [Desulfocurvus sp. DL9XJH121]